MQFGQARLPEHQLDPAAKASRASHSAACGMGSNQRHRKRVTSLALAMLLICENLGAYWGRMVGLKVHDRSASWLLRAFFVPMKQFQKFELGCWNSKPALSQEFSISTVPDSLPEPCLYLHCLTPSGTRGADRGRPACREIKYFVCVCVCCFWAPAGGSSIRYFEGPIFAIFTYIYIYFLCFFADLQKFLSHRGATEHISGVIRCCWAWHGFAWTRTRPPRKQQQHQRLWWFQWRQHSQHQLWHARSRDHKRRQRGFNTLPGDVHHVHQNRDVHGCSNVWCWNESFVFMAWWSCGMFKSLNDFIFEGCGDRWGALVLMMRCWMILISLFSRPD